MRRALERLYALCAGLAALFLAAIGVLTLAQIGGRLAGLLVPLADEFAGFCLAAATFLALAPTLRAGGHVRVGLMLSRTRGRGRRLVEAWCLAVGAAVTGYFAWYSADMTWESFQFGDVGQGLVPTPLWIPQLGMTVGIAVLAVAFVDDLVRVVRGHGPSYAAADDGADARDAASAERA